MDPEALYRRLSDFGPILTALTDNLNAEEAHWRPTSNDWSVVEIVRHLGDEEREDFRPRVQSTLADPHARWTPINPNGWPTERDYQAASLPESVAAFLEARRSSLEWLQPRLAELREKGAQTYQSQAGPLRLGDLFASWAAHDQLHIRQIAKRRLQLIERDTSDYSVEYAGNW